MNIKLRSLKVKEGSKGSSLTKLSDDSLNHVVGGVSFEQEVSASFNHKFAYQQSLLVADSFSD